MNGGYDGFVDVVRDKELLSTAEELFKCHLNISEAARKLYLHRNTLLYRIEKIKNLSGLDIKKFEEAVIFRTVITLYKFKGR
jgi:DNA-binding PucR family transcriptional regulator